MNITLDDIIIDPACGTGGFLIQCLIDLKNRYPHKEQEISRWAQLRLFGIDKDAIGIKLTKEFANSTDSDGYNYIASVSAFDTGEGTYE